MAGVKRFTDPGPMARLEQIKADPESPAEVFRLLTDDEPKRLSQIAKLWRVPKGHFAQWFMESHAALYDAALKVLAADKALDAAQAAMNATPETVAVARLRADVDLKLASRFDRQRYGDAVRVQHSATLEFDAGLVGSIAELVHRKAEAKDAEVVPALTSDAGQ